MTQENFIIELFCRVDDMLPKTREHIQAKLSRSELVTLGLLMALKGTSQRAFYRWLKQNWIDLFPRLPERTRLFRRLKTHRKLTEKFLAEPTVFGVIDSYGIELCHPSASNPSTASPKNRQERFLGLEMDCRRKTLSACQQIRTRH